ncbi:MAG TPA: hypothetical protein PLW50_00715 [Smithellaceae bacterium]|nr:hypothetical protein [Smithellaceae bacterium]
MDIDIDVETKGALIGFALVCFLGIVMMVAFAALVGLLFVVAIWVAATLLKMLGILGILAPIV